MKKPKFRVARIRNYSRSKCHIGHYHQSKMEASYCDQLSILKKNGDIKSIEYQKVYELKVNDILITRHKPDFVILLPSGKKEVHEVKGFETDLWRIKHKLFMACYPDIEYIIIK